MDAKRPGICRRECKNNAQLPETDPLARQLGGMVLDALDRHAQFRSAALPLKIVPPLFNRYSGGQTYGEHIDGALRPVPGSRAEGAHRPLSHAVPQCAGNYDGGELVIKDSLGERRVKLPAGDMVLYPGNTVHSVMPVTRGTRLASFFWIQSAVRDNEQRALLYELDGVVQELGATPPRMRNQSGWQASTTIWCASGPTAESRSRLNAARRPAAPPDRAFRLEFAAAVAERGRRAGSWRGLPRRARSIPNCRRHRKTAHARRGL